MRRVLCRHCRRRLDRHSAACPRCGASASPHAPALELLLPDGRRVPLTADVSIGRDPACAVVLADPTVSRRHALVRAASDGDPRLEDTGSRFGTFADDERVTAPVPVRDGTRIRCGDVELRAERPRADADAGRTVVVRPAADAELALKRLELPEGPKRWVVEDRRSGGLLRLGQADAELLAALDGDVTPAGLSELAEARWGAPGRERARRLLASLDRHGFLGAPAPAARRRRLLRTRQLSVRGVERPVERLYDWGGWLLFTAPARLCLAALAVCGAAIFAALVTAGAEPPLTVRGSVAAGSAVFLAGRVGLIGAHELAHALTMASLGRPVRRAGIKFVLVFPSVFVDTSASWLEPRRRRLAVTAAGPVSDLALAGGFALAAAALAPAPTAHAVLFQLAVAAYTGALMNLNPCVTRDGYHLLVDLLREPNLRPRALEHLSDRLKGRRRPAPRALGAYAAATLAWSAVVSGLITIGALRMTEHLRASLPAAVTPLLWPAVVLAGAAALLPLLLLVVPPLLARRRSCAS